MYKTWSRTAEICASECDISGAWRPGAMMEALQEVAAVHCDLLGAGRAELRKKGAAWVVTRMQVEMNRYPRIGEKITVETFHTPVRRWFFPRYFIIRDEQGKQVGAAASLWVLLDLNTRHMIQPGQIELLMPDNSDLPAPLGLPGAVQDVGGVLHEWDFKPAYTDMDYNGHVNNTRYMDWCCNALGIELLAEKELATFTLNYHFEIRPGQQVHAELKRLADDFAYTAYVESERRFEVGGTLRNRSGKDE